MSENDLSGLSLQTIMNKEIRPTYLHPLDMAGTAWPSSFTYPFRYTTHPLCLRAAAIVQAHVKAEGLDGEGKMYGVLVVEGGFLAAYSGQIAGSYAHPWFVPPVYDYLAPDSYFQIEQAEIMNLSERIGASSLAAEIELGQERLEAFTRKREAAVEEARRRYERGKKERAARRAALNDENAESLQTERELERESQFQKAEIKRAKRLFEEEIKETDRRLTELRQRLVCMKDERRGRSEALQRWLFGQFDFRNARNEHRTLTELFDGEPPSGAGECCAPKLLNAAYALGLRPLAMAEFWWGPALRGGYRRPGVFYPACNRKCRPILSFMLEGLSVEPDPAGHYDCKGGDVEVVWEDAWMAVVAKPTGWLSVAGKTPLPDVCQWARRHWGEASESGTSQTAMRLPAAVHRLDQDTSGLMILAKTQMSYSWLQKMFEARKVRKRYVALLDGRWQRAQMSGTVDLPLAPDYDDLPRQRVDYDRGSEAVTKFEVIAQEKLHEDGAGLCASDVTRIAFYPLTGRTHQLRVHASSPSGLGMAICGDRLYGRLARRLYLHAEALDFEHPATGQPLHFELPAPF